MNTTFKQKNSHGFSLVELSVMLIVSGLMITSAVQVNKTYVKQKRENKVESTLDVVTEATMNFFSKYGHYPCPAPTSASPRDADYGVSSDCTASVATGCGSGEFCIAENDSKRIRIGSIPFRTLAEGLASDPYEKNFLIGAEDTLDPYKKRMSYAVTELQASEDYLVRQGAIIVKDEHNKVMRNNADFIIISHGDNQKGAVPAGGGAPRYDCTGSEKDVENCDGDATFVDSIMWQQAGSKYYDDRVAHTSWIHYFLWDVSEDNPDNIYNLNEGNVGIGTNDPLEKLHVADGDMRLGDDVTTGDLNVTEICNGDGEDCFSPLYIAGTSMGRCADNQAATGIANKMPVCEALLVSSQNLNCPAGEYMNGYSYDTSTKMIEILCGEDMRGKGGNNGGGGDGAGGGLGGGGDGGGLGGGGDGGGGRDDGSGSGDGALGGGGR